MSKPAFVLSITFLFFYCLPALASQGLPSPKCAVKGMVVAENARTVEGQGMSEGEIFTYHDITLKVIEQSFLDDAQKSQFENSKFTPEKCDQENVEVTYQKKDSGSFSLGGMFGADAKKLDGQCIKATSHFFADGNFQSGNWLYDIKILDISACQ